MAKEIYITIGMHTDNFAKHNVGKTTNWPVKKGALKGARVYFLIGTEFVARGIVASETVTRDDWHGSPKLFREVHEVQMLNAPVSLELIREQISDWGWPRSKQPIQTSVPPQFETTFLQILHDPPTPSDADATVLKVKVEYEKRIRASEMIKRLKAKYRHRCHIKSCDFRLPLSTGVDYVEGHHVKPLAHGGPDTASNILILCPNHHAFFDYRVPVFETRMRIRIGDRVETLRPHDLSQKFIDFHNSMTSESDRLD